MSANKRVEVESGDSIRTGVRMEVRWNPHTSTAREAREDLHAAFADLLALVRDPDEETT